MKLFKNLNNPALSCEALPVRRSFSEVGAKQGFSFLEVVMAITIVGLMLTALFTLQTTMFNNVVNGHFRISRIFFLKNFLYDDSNLKNAQKEKKAIEKDLKEPTMKMQYELKKLSDKKYQDIYIVQARGTWQGLRRQHEEKLVRLVYVKPKTLQQAQGDRGER